MLKQIWNLLDEKEQKTGVLVGISVFLRAILDFAGVAALIPILILILGDKPDKRLALLLCFGVLAFVVFKNLLGILLTRYQTRFLLRLYKKFSHKLFYNYYHRGLLFLKEKNSAHLTNEVNFVCYAFSLNVLQQILLLLSSALLVILMVLALVIWSPKAGLLLCLGFVPLVLFYLRFIKKRAREYGKEEIEVRREQARTVTEAFRGFSELEVSEAFPVLEKTFLMGLDKINNCRMRMTMIGMVPTAISEASIIVGLVLLLLLGDGDLRIISGVFAVAAYRLIPAVRSILSSWTLIKNYSYCLDIISDGISDQDFQINGNSALSFDSEIALNNIHFSYPEAEYKIFSGLSLIIKKGDRLGIRGTSGAGKSTLFHLMLGLFHPDTGSICIDGKELNRTNLKAWHNMVGYVPQEIFIMKGSLAQNIALGKADIDEKRIWEVLEQVQLKEWVESLPQGIHTSLGEFGSKISGGQKQRIGIARALYKHAQILFFDEATSSLDNQTEHEVNQAILKLSQEHQELTLIIIAHRESSLQNCNRIFSLE